MISPHGKGECWTTLWIATMVAATAGFIGQWWAVVAAVLAVAAVVFFFRDPERMVPPHRGVMVSPADGRISSIHQVDHFEPFGGPATCIRIFLSVFDVHVQRCPCHGRIASVTHKPGLHRNALNPKSCEDNEACLTVLQHQTRDYPLAAVRQIAGLIARRIVCTATEGDILQRGQRLGIIKFGSCVELYVPAELDPHVSVVKGERVSAGSTVLATITAPEHEPAGGLVSKVIAGEVDAEDDEATDAASGDPLPVEMDDEETFVEAEIIEDDEEFDAGDKEASPDLVRSSSRHP